jgi:hypothetical protein
MTWRPKGDARQQLVYKQGASFAYASEAGRLTQRQTAKSSS